MNHVYAMHGKKEGLCIVSITTKMKNHTNKAVRKAIVQYKKIKRQ